MGRRHQLSSVCKTAFVTSDDMLGRLDAPAPSAAPSSHAGGVADSSASPSSRGRSSCPATKGDQGAGQRVALAVLGLLVVAAVAGVVAWPIVGTAYGRLASRPGGGARRLLLRAPGRGRGRGHPEARDRGLGDPVIPRVRAPAAQLDIDLVAPIASFTPINETYE